MNIILIASKATEWVRKIIVICVQKGISNKKMSFVRHLKLIPQFGS